MDDVLLETLRSVDTPTVCNAIEAAEGQRGFNNFTKGTMFSSAPDAKAVVGYALTAKSRPKPRQKNRRRSSKNGAWAIIAPLLRPKNQRLP